MRITIASISSAILDCLSNPGRLGEIHSVFDRAVNIKLDHVQRLIALTFSPAGRLPYALMVADGQLSSFTAIGIKPGQIVTLSDERCLLMEGVKAVFDYREASGWSPNMDRLSDPEDSTAFLELLTWASGFVFEQSNHAGLVPLLENHRQLFEGKLVMQDDPDIRIARMALPAVMDLLTALNRDDPTTLANSTARLLGYGIGGTPSGDDLLVGMLAALHRSSSPRANRLLKILSSTLAEQLIDTVTSLLSLTVLRHALAGEFSEKVHDVTRQLMQPVDSTALTASLDGLHRYGATSGSEMFLGICLGFELIYLS